MAKHEATTYQPAPDARLEYTSLRENAARIPAADLCAWIERERSLGRSSVTVDQVKQAIAQIVHRRRAFGRARERRHLALTIHQAKNREFDSVVVLWPLRIHSGAEQQRRLLYNAITRARRQVIDSLLSADIKTELGTKGYATVPVSRAEDAAGFFLRGQAVGRDQAVHTATDIPVSAYSRSDAWRAFVGVQTNTDIFFKIGKLILGPGRHYDASIERWSEEQLRLAPPGR